MALLDFEEMERRRKERNGQFSGHSTGNTTGGLLDYNKLEKERRARMAQQKAGEMQAQAKNLQARVSKWLKDSKSYIDGYSARFAGRDGSRYVADAGSYLDAATKTKIALDAERDDILRTLSRQGALYDPQWASSVRSALIDSSDLHSSVLADATKDRDYWAQFAPNEQQIAAGYDTAEKVFQAWQKDSKYRTKHEGKNRDEINRSILYAEDEQEADWLRNRATELWTSADEQARYERLNRDVAPMEQDLQRYNDAIQNLGAGSQVKELIIQEINEKYGSKTQLEGLISKAKADSALIKRNADMMALTDVNNPNSDVYDPEFAKLSAYDPIKASGDYAYLNMGEKERAKFVNDRMMYSMVPGDTSAIDANNAMRARYEMLDKLTPEEIAVYNYYVNTGATDKAAAYLERMADTMNERVGADMFAGMKDRPLLELAYSGVAGLDQFDSGMKGVVRSVTGNDSDTPTSAIQYAGSMAREDLGDVDLKWYDFKEGNWRDADIAGSSLGQSLYDFGTTTANMVPSILTSTAIGLINPAAGQVAGVALLGGSAAGNAYQEKINLGYSADQARAYGYMVGASEAVLEYALGGIAKLGGKALGTVSTKLLDKVDNVLARAAKTAGGKMLMAGVSEGIEEGLQSIIEPYIWQAVSGEEAQVDWEETLYSSLLGFMSGGMFEGVERVNAVSRQNAQQNAQAKEYYGQSQKELVAEALEIDPANAYAQKMQALLDKGKDLSGKQLGRLVEQNSNATAAEMMPALREAVANRLKSMGETSDVSVLTDALIKNFSGAKLTAEETSRITSSRNAAAVAEDLDAANHPQAPTPGWLADSFDAIPVVEAQEIATSPAAPRNDNGVQSGKERISMADFANNASPVWRNVAYDDTNTKTRIMQEAHDAMVAEGSVVKVSKAVAGNVEQSFPDLREMKKKERTPILKKAMTELKNNLRQFLNGFKEQNIEFEVNGKILDAKLYNTGINEVLEKVTKQKAEMLYTTGEIFQNARYLYSTPDYDGDPNVYRWNYFYTPVEVEGETVGVRVAVRDMAKGTDGATPESQVYNWGIKKDAPLGGGSHDQAAASSGASSDAFNNSISETQVGVNGENVDPVAQLAAEAVDLRNAADEVASAEGRAILGDTAVDVVGISDAGKGKVTVEIADGRRVDATALEYEDSGEAELWRVIGKYAENAESARALMEEYRLGNVDAYKYARGVEEAFLFGKLNMSPREMQAQGSYVNLLDHAQKKMAYKQGMIAGQRKAQLRQDKVAANRKGIATQAEQARNDRKKGQLHFEGDRESLTERQKVSLQACEVVAKALGIQVYVFESEKVNGKRVGENGWYDPKDGSIHIDLHAGQNGEGVMVFTLAHELTHFIRDWSPQKFRTLSGFLAEQYAKNGQSVADLVRDQQRRAEEDGRKLSFEEAHEEWVADSMEQMLTDGTVMEKLAMLQAKDKSLVEKIKTFLNDFGKRLKAAYASLNPRSKEAHIVADMVDAAAELQNLFTDALLDAGENFQTAEKNTTGEGGVRFSMRYSDAIEKLNDGTLDRSENTHLKLLDETPRLYIDKAGAKNLKVIMGWDIAYLAMRKSGDIPGNYHGLGVEIMKQIPKAIKNPLYIVKQKNGRIAAITEIVVKGKKPVFASIELDAFKTITQEGVHEEENYNLVVTVMDAHPRYLKNSVFLGEVVYNKNNEAPAHFIARLKTLNKAVPTNDLAKASNDSIDNPDGIVKENDSTEKRTSSRSGDVSDRGMLVDLFEQMVTDSNEHKALQNYKKNMDQMLALEEKVDRLTEEIKRVSFAEGPRNMEYLDNLKWQRKKAVAELNRYDNILLNLEKSGVLRSMIERNRAVATQESYKKAREYYRQKNETRETEIRQYYRESRRQAVERHDKAQVRQQIRKDVQKLDSLLNKGTKEKNVKLELQDFAGAALRTAKGTFLKNYNEYDMVRNGVNGTMSRENKAVFARAQALLKELDKIWEERNSEPSPNSIHEKWDPEENLRRDDHEEALKKELAKNMAVLREAGIFRVENELMEDSIADQLMNELMEAYEALKNSESAHVREVFNSAIYDHMKGVKKSLAGKAIKDMTAIELGKLKDMYRMVLHTITTSNDLFAQKRKADVRVLGEEVIGQLRTPGKEMTAEVLDTLKKMGWANLKPETALELIGSDTLTEMMQGLYHGEDTYARDLEQARQYAEEQGKKYGRNKWDMKKTVSFAGTKITLGQAMSLYAYTKRKQAQGHLEDEGFTHSSNVRIEAALGKLPVKVLYIMNATRTYIVPKGAYADVAALLTPEQRKYVDAMQEYLSKVMGAKGNEVSMQLYGIKLFEETMYFPLKTASEYREEALGATAGEVKLRNTGFTQNTVDGASNPIVLDDFESVWAGHVDKMSLYHGFVLPMEDFDRVYNYRHAVEEGVTDAEGEVYKTKLVDTNESVKVDIENKMGKAANDYIENFMKQLNGGVRGDATEKLFGKMMRNFKKTAVLGSLSVAVQQPTAFIRAMAYLDVRDVGNPKDFLGKDGKPEAGILKEMYKYAPVALMKKIGGFDPGLGKTAKEYVFTDKQGITGAVDKFLGMFPEKMDEWTWSYIWICTKRQIHRQNPDLKINSEEFLQKTGERFSKIIRDTQVYDSVLTKSQIMRSKNMFLQMATSFMNEPTTSMDMYIRSAIQAKRGKIKKGQVAKTYAAVVFSQILTSAVVAFVYALRDDDEDETYWEKYLSAAINKAWENTMPWYSIPFVKDAFSIFEGYSVERSDMSLITDLYQGWQKLQSDKATPWEKTEAFAGSILNVFGIPLKNVSRDIRGIYNTVNTWFSGGVEKTGAGLRYAAKEGLTGKKASKEVQLRNAVAENDAKHILRVMASYSTEDSALAGFRSAVKEAYLQGGVTEEQAAEFLQAYAGDDAADAGEKVTKWQAEKETGIKFDDIKDRFIAGGISEEKAKEMYMTYGGYDEEETGKKLTYWKFLQANPKSKLTQGPAIKYVEFAEPAGISLEIYTRYAEATKDLESDKDKDGKTITDSKRNKVLAEIHKLPLSTRQKDALYYAEEYAESRLHEVPWH